MRGKRIDQETRAAITAAYLADDSISFKQIAEQFGIAMSTAQRIIHDELKAGAGVKPDRRKRNADGSEGILEGEMDKRHAERLAEQNAELHPRTSDWMDHIAPIHQRKQELEIAIEHKQAELDKARQEYRDFLATLKQLMEESV